MILDPPNTRLLNIDRSGYRVFYIYGEYRIQGVLRIMYHTVQNEWFHWIQNVSRTIVYQETASIPYQESDTECIKNYLVPRNYRYTISGEGYRMYQELSYTTKLQVNRTRSRIQNVSRTIVYQETAGIPYQEPDTGCSKINVLSGVSSILITLHLNIQYGIFKVKDQNLIHSF